MIVTVAQICNKMLRSRQMAEKGAIVAINQRQDSHRSQRNRLVNNRTAIVIVVRKIMKSTIEIM